MVQWREAHGSIAVWLMLWLTMMLAVGWAADNLAAALIGRQQLISAMTTAAETVDRSMRFTGPNRFTEAGFVMLADRDLGGGRQIVLTRFAVRAGGPWRWEIAASGYLWIPRWIPFPTAGLVRVSAAVGPGFPGG